MREEFVTKVKTFILSQPDSEQGLASIKDYVQQINASEEEYTEALRQVVVNSISKQQSIEPHELMLRPEHALEEREVEIEERPEHTLMVQELRDTEKPKREKEIPYDEIKNDIREHDREQLTAFQKELARTKESLIQTFEEELEKQREALMANQEEIARRDSAHHPIHKILATSTARVTGLILFLIAGVFTALIASIIQKPSESTSHAESHGPIITDSRRLIPQVFASTEMVNPAQVFSFPPTTVSLVTTGTPAKEVLGFFPYWMMDTEEKISLNNLTTIALFGLEMDGGGNIQTVDPIGKPSGGWQMYNDPRLSQLLLRAKRQNINAYFTLKMFDNTNIENLVRSDTAQKQFISNALHIVNSKNLKGINLDFEYIGTPPDDVRDGFTRLITNLSSEMKRQIPGSLLTLDTYVTAAADRKLFDIPILSSSVDAFVVMGYDIHTPSSEPGPIAPMEGEIGIIGLMQSYIDKVDPSKLILAVPYYGYDWTVPKTAANQATITTYAQALDQSKSVPLQWNDSAQSPYFLYANPETHTNHEVHFENARSLGIKYDFVNRKNLKGIGIWALGYDGQNTDLQSLIIEKFGTPHQ